ncbi:putative PEP-binding protein [Noviherbaspirillum sp. L7-7A]|uniref:putative PEP-binding protein n=1 Tax=Noviherbaspirillum sp. L7-7A TaxID=2850560 RepID=UPI0032C4288D
MSGRANVVADMSELGRFQRGGILVPSTTMPDWGTVMKQAAAVLTNHGGRTCHAAIVARELGIPAVLGCDDATGKIRSGDEVTVFCAEGGTLAFLKTSTGLSDLPMPGTRLMINVDNPDLAFQLSFLPNDGVGLARVEFIVAEHIRAHPMALAHPERVDDPAERKRILGLASAYPSPADYFVTRLSEGVGTIAAAFDPKAVIVRMFDFKTNEYASLPGGRWFEPVEANPIIGFCAAGRSIHPAYAYSFALECRAMKKVRSDVGLDNVRLMIAFCRRVNEARRVLDAMAGLGLARGVDALEVYAMCEIPNNVLQIDAFAALFVGFSIGSNDLTQLVLGVDRDSEIVSFDFDERDPGVLEMLLLAIEGEKRCGRHVGICGQAPSDYPILSAFLVKQGKDSISLNPDSVIPTIRTLLEVAQQLGIQPRPPGLACTRRNTMNLHAADLMTTPVITAQGDQTVAAVAATMHQHRLSFMPVTEKPAARR